MTLESLLVAGLTAMQFTQASMGELCLTVTDASGLPVQSAVELINEASHVRENLQTDVRGAVVVKRLPFGSYRIAVSSDGFASFTGLVEIRSALPTDYHVALGLVPVQAQVTVTPD